MSNLYSPRILITTLLLVCSFFGVSGTFAQQSTEQFIPIGMSPGVSDKSTFIGDITAVNKAENNFIIHSNRGNKTLTILPTTRFWLDRSKAKKSNIQASFDDCKVGSKVEVMYDLKDNSIADWVKIEN